jgi:hypothetical protein
MRQANDLAYAAWQAHMPSTVQALCIPLSVTISVCSMLSGCGGDKDHPGSTAGSGGDASGGTSSTSAGKSSGGTSSPSGGKTSSGGTSSTSAGKGSGGKAGSGGSSPADGGKSSSAGAGSGPIVPTPGCTGEPRWTDISSTKISELGGASAQSYPAGVSGVLVNHLTGDVTIHIVGFGLWRSSDKGDSWTRIDDNVVDKNGGRCETGWGLQADPEDPTRIASFTLDGTAGYTPDGTAWQLWAESGWGRNWDFGAVDWSSAGAQTIFGVLHETSPRSVYLISTDGGASWSKMDNGRVANTVGVIDENTLIATRTSGIERSTNLGDSWTSVSDVTPLGHVFLKFKGNYYVTTASGILVSTDQGMSWQQQGVAIPNAKMFQGPYFGDDENTMVVGTQPDDNAFGGGSAIYKTSDGGASWTKIAEVPSPGNGFPISFAWYGSFAWDPTSDTYYASSMSNPVYRLDCSP